jgi:hypothetical protein
MKVTVEHDYICKDCKAKCKWSGKDLTVVYCKDFKGENNAH